MLHMKYSLCFFSLYCVKNNFALLSVFLPTRGIYIQLRDRLKKVRRNMPERLVFPHIAALFGTLTSSMVSTKKHHAARKNKPLRCEAVFGEQIFVETRQKGE